MANTWFKSTAKQNYTKMGRKNKTSYKGFVKVCKMTQAELKKHLTKFLEANYKSVVVGDGFIYARGDFPVLVTAHMDTVHNQKVKDFYEFVDKANGNRHIISSPQGIGGDDRCGVYMIKEIIKSGLKPYVLFCEDEEIGGVGSEKFCKTTYVKELEKMMFMVELDRAHGNDLVYYSDENEDFHAFCEIATGYIEDWGTFSDISHLSPACKVSSVNISCGYYNAHTTDEYVVMEEMETSIKATENLLRLGIAEGKAYEYKVTPRRAYGYGYGYGSYFDDFYYRSRVETNVEKEVENEVEEEMENDSKIQVYTFFDNGGCMFQSVGNTFEEAVGNLMLKTPWLSWDDIEDYMTEDEMEDYFGILKETDSEYDESIGNLIEKDELFDDRKESEEKDIEEDEDIEDMEDTEFYKLLESFANQNAIA